MSSHPSFIYDQYRPGIETEAHGQIWRYWRESLDGIISSTFAEAGAARSRSGLEAPETDQTLGDATIIEASRQKPPMTAEVARKLGQNIVAEWTEVANSREIPAFCDMVYSLPEEQ